MAAVENATPDKTLELLAEVSQTLTETDHERVWERVLDLTMRAVGAERATLVMLPQQNEDVRQMFVRDFLGSAALDKREWLKVADGILTSGFAGSVVRSREAAIIDDTRGDSRWLKMPDSAEETRSALSVPFVYDGEVVAVLTVVHREPKHFNQQHLRLMTIIASQVAIAAQNARLFQQTLKQQRQLEAVLNTIPDLLMALDAHGEIIQINHAGAQFLAHDAPREALVGRHLSEFTAAEGALKPILDILADPLPGASDTFEVRSERLRRDFLVTVSAWDRLYNSKPGHVVVMRDVSVLRDLNRFKDEMFKLLSHDLRSPLALIVGYCSLIELDAPPDSPVLDHVAAVLKATTRMKGMLDDLLRVEKIRTSPVEMDEVVSFAKLAEEAAANSKMTLDAKNQTLNVEISIDPGIELMLNRALVREAMENYLNNASKYTPEGGEICVRALLRDGRAAYEVQDNGIGIPPEAMGKLFQSFMRLKQPGYENADGRGLGLSLVKTIIERHNGSVWAESEPGKGSTFGFWLPLSGE